MHAQFDVCRMWTVRMTVSDLKDHDAGVSKIERIDAVDEAAASDKG